METKTSTSESGSTTRLSNVEVLLELSSIAYTQKDFNQVITLVWALPDQFWVRVAKRLIATCIVGIQFVPGVPPSE